MSKPRCCWVGDGPCKSPTCADWPVCRSHLRVWGNASPWEMVKRRPIDRATLRTGTRWAEERGLVGSGPWVELRFPAHGGLESTAVIVIVQPDDATAMSDWYLSQGDDGSAAKLHRIVHSTAAIGPSRQTDLFGGVAT